MNLLRSEPSGENGGPPAYSVIRRFGLGGLIAALMCLAAAPVAPLSGQSITLSEIAGSVALEDGRGANAAFVVLTEVATGIQIERTTRSNGSFEFLVLPAGEYEVRAEALGYHPVIMTSVNLGLREAVTVSLTFRQAPPLAIQIDSIRSGPENTTRHQVESIQSLGSALFANVPRINNDLGGATALFTSMDRYFGGGGLPGSESILLADGVPQISIRHPLQRGTGFNHFAVPLSMVRSVELPTAAQDVEWTGGGGRVVSLTTGQKQLSPATYFLSVGDASIGRASALDGSGISFWGGAGRSLSLGQGNARLLLAGEGMRNRTWRAPSLSSGVIDELGNAGGLTAEQLQVLGAPSFDDLNAMSGLARLDWQANEATRIGARLSGGRYEALSTALPGGGLSYGQILPGTRTEISAVSEVFRRINTRFDFEGRLGVGFGSMEVPGTVAEGAGLSGLRSSYLVSEGVGIGLQPGLETTTSKTEIFASPVFHFRDGNYRVKFGAALRYTLHDQDHLVGSAGSYLFSSATGFRERTGLFFRTEGGEREQSFSNSELGAFVQYLWNPLRTFEVIAGFRVDAESVPVEDATTEDVPWQDYTGIPRLPDYRSVRKFGGNLGVQWAPSGDATTVLRASVGVRNGRIDPAVLGEFRTLDGTGRVYTETGQISSSPGSGPTVDLPRRLALLGPNLAPPRTFEAVVEASRQISSGTRIGIAGTFRRTDFLMRRTDLNRLPDPVSVTADGRPVFGELGKIGTLVYAIPGTNRRFLDFDFVWALNSDGWSTFQGITLTLDHDVGAELNLHASYTLSRTEDNWFGAASLMPEASLIPITPADADDSPWEEGISDFDMPHRVAVGTTWTPAFFPRVRWTPVYRFNSGTPFTPMVRAGADIDGDGSAFNDVAVVPSRQLLGELAGEWSCLGSQSGSFAERNSCREPARHEIDLAVEVNLFGLGNSALSLVIEGMNLTDSRSGLRDSSLLVPNADLPISSSGTTISIPMTVNSNFGDLLVPTNAGRTLRATLRIR